MFKFLMISIATGTAETTALYKMRRKDTIFYSVVRYKNVKNAQNAQQKVNIIGDINLNSFLK